MFYYVVFLGLMTSEHVREVLTVEHGTSFINNLNKTKGKQSNHGHISDQIQRNFQHIREAVEENEDKHIYNIRGRQKTRAKAEDDDYSFDNSKAPYFAMIVTVLPRAMMECSGTILSNCLVLTAAHCVSTRIEGNQTNPFQAVGIDKIKIFSGNLYDDDWSPCKGLWIHPEYLQKPEVELYRDIAVVQSSEAIIYSPTTQMAHIHPVVQSKDVPQMTQCSIVDFSSLGGEGKLKMTTVTMTNQKECKAMMKNMIDEEVQVCVLGVDVDICTEMSGLGFLCDGKVFALTSWGISFESGKSSACIYARVDNVQDFITPLLEEVECKAAFFSPTLITLLNVILLHLTQ